jgi:1-acyl-sn-glycerol-3-phosphate acyltransferase
MEHPKTGKTSGMAFRPPLPNKLLQALIKMALPFFFKNALKGYSVEVDEESLQRLRAIAGERCLLLPNHPSQWDPWAMAALSKRLNENFYYVAAREVFDWMHGIQGWIMQHFGAYSVVRGASDKESFKTTKEILSQNKGRLVIFVEGEISNQNDSLLPLEPGVVQLAFLALQDAYKHVGKDLEKLPSLYVCPIAIKYLYNPKGLNETIEQAVSDLEKATGLTKEDKSLYQRVRSVGLMVLKETSRQFGYPLSEEHSLDEQIQGVEDFMLTKMEQVVNLPYDPSLRYLDRVRRIRNSIDRVMKEVPEEQTLYEERLHEHQKAVLKNFYWDLERIVNFIAIYDGYIHPDMIPERYVEVIRRLEKEVFGSYHLVHPRTAVIKALEPVNLKSHFEAFLHDKKKVSEELIQDIEHNMYHAIVSTRTPVHAG